MRPDKARHARDTTHTLRFETIVFDLDGTLVHTAPDLAWGVNRLLADEGFGPLDEATVVGMVGGGLARLMAKAFHAVGASDAEAAAEARAQAFLRNGLADPAPRSTLYEGVEAVLDGYLGEGRRLAICTNKAEPLAEAVLAALGLAPRFDAIVGGGSRPRKPDPTPLRDAITLAGGTPGSAVMIGDSATDLESARNLGIPCVLVTYGYHHGRIHALSPDARIDHFSELPAALEGL